MLKPLPPQSLFSRPNYSWFLASPQPPNYSNSWLLANLDYWAFARHTELSIIIICIVLHLSTASIYPQHLLWDSLCFWICFYVYRWQISIPSSDLCILLESVWLSCSDQISPFIMEMGLHLCFTQGAIALLYKPTICSSMLPPNIYTVF